MTSRGDGAFSVPHVPGGETLSLLVTAEIGGISRRGRAEVEPVRAGITDAGSITANPVEPVADPLTSAAGRVIDYHRGVPFVGARVLIFTDWDVFPATTDADGRFLVPGIPTVDGELFAVVSGLREGYLYDGRADFFLPVPGGTTDLGEIRVVGGPPPSGGGGG